MSSGPVYEEVFEEKEKEEMKIAVAETSAASTKIDQAKQQGFSGSICGSCGSLRMKVNGSCEVCLDCGATSGCS
jgi:ribonucleoside-diphosphate reductase alpha chain